MRSLIQAHFSLCALTNIVPRLYALDVTKYTRWIKIPSERYRQAASKWLQHSTQACHWANVSARVRHIPIKQAHEKIAYLREREEWLGWQTNQEYFVNNGCRSSSRKNFIDTSGMNVV